MSCLGPSAELGLPQMHLKERIIVQQEILNIKGAMQIFLYNLFGCTKKSLFNAPRVRYFLKGVQLIKIKP